MISARIIADSLTHLNNRLTTYVVTFPRIVLAEFNTHRMLSRNSASSRARPHHVTMKEVMENPFIPIAWMKNHKGMQGEEYVTDSNQCLLLQNQWLEARNSAVKHAEMLNEMGLTKQMTNRLLEPFMLHTVIVTGTEWDNFFALRANQAAEIHIQKLAYLMLAEYQKSQPKLLKPGQWHIPFGDQFDDEQLKQLIPSSSHEVGSASCHEEDNSLDAIKVKIATARCARISYAPFGELGQRQSYAKDIELHDRLSSMGHWSPFEHCARAMTNDEYYHWVTTPNVNSKEYGWCGNFRGYIQYRKMFSGENKTDERLHKDGQL
jgi:thymidylate synthase ThyX